MTAALAVACAEAVTPAEDDPYDPVGIDPYIPEPPIFDPVEVDAGSIDVPERPRAPDATAPSPPTPDAGPDGAVVIPQCAPLAPGALEIVELMIKSIDGSGDRGEWVELRNPNACILQIPAGLRVISPRGAALDVATIEAAFELAPGAAFLAGGAEAPSHPTLPTARWSSVDTLKNSGDEVRVELDGTLIDSLTYPSISNLTARRSIAFPSDCDGSQRANLQSWSGSFATDGTLTATPFAANDDVTCPP